MARGRFGGGEGSYDNPYLIEDSYDLHAIRLFVDKYFKLVYDINLGHAPFTDGQGWKPIKGFTGHLDGNGKTIHNLYINTREDYVGLFDKYNYPATVKNLSFKGVNITGGSYVGTIFGSLINARTGDYITHENFAIENVSISGRMRVYGSYGGAFAGLVSYSNGTETIRLSTPTGTTYVWSAFKNLFTDMNLVKLDSESKFVSGMFGSIRGLLLQNTYYSQHHYTNVKGFNLINCGNFSVSNDNNGRTNPIFTSEGTANGRSITSSYVNINSWRKNLSISIDPESEEEIITEITYTDGSKELTSEEAKDQSNYLEELVDHVDNAGNKIWHFESLKNEYPKLYFSGADMAFIKLNDGLYVYENDDWVKKFDDVPDIEDAEGIAMSSLKDIPAEAWEKLKTLSLEPQLVNIVKKHSTYYTGSKDVDATDLSNFATANKKYYKQTINFFDFSDGVFKIETTE